MRTPAHCRNAVPDRHQQLIAIDLFAGGGGLSLGLKKAGFTVSGAVELDGVACDTYRANHPDVVMFQTDISAIKGKELLRTSPTGSVDLIAACPPCQGFSSLTSKYRRDDLRNKLIFEFVRLVEEIKPKFLMMENVPGLATKGKLLFDEALKRFSVAGYNLDYKVVNVMDYGVPQSRRRLVLLGVLKGQVKVPSPTHGKGRRPYKTVRDALARMGDPVPLRESLLRGGPSKFNWHIVRDVSEITKRRLAATAPGMSRVSMPERLKPRCHKGGVAGFTNVYGRMSWDEPSPTITGGCVTLSKGRFGHPEQLRTISVREAALLQTFPRNYQFSSQKIDSVCKVVGNALPPLFAKIMAEALCSAATEVAI